MINPKTKTRELAYAVLIKDIKSVPYADRCECAVVNGWEVLVHKGEFKIGDLVVYFEIDSKLPEEPQYEFLRNKGFKIKTQRYKFGGDIPFISQGLIMSIKDVGLDINKIKEGDFLTETLKVIYYDPEDNARKNFGVSEYQKREQRFKERHPKLYAWVKKHKHLRKIFNLFFGRKIKKKSAFPTHLVSKTDEERIQNMAWILKDKQEFIVTEKIDGTSTTFIMERGKKLKVYSRNVDMTSLKKEGYEKQGNIYAEMAEKYNVEKTLKDYLKKNKNAKWVCIQGESFGYGWQGNPYKMTNHDFRAFNLIDSEVGRYPSDVGKALLAEYDIPWVPIIHTNYILPDTVDELIQAATGPTTLNKDLLREGWVIRSKDGKTSFKAVSNEYLLKKGS